MAFGFAGAGAGGAKALEDIVAERILQQKLEQEISDRQSRAELEQQQMDQRAKEFGIESGQRQQQIDMQAADRRARDNDKGVRRMISESLMQGGTPDRKALAAMQIEAGDAPTMLNEPPSKKYEVTVPGPDGKPMKRLVDEAEMAKGVPTYQEPKSGTEKGPYVVGGNLVDASGKIIFRAQDNSAAGPSPYAQERNARTVAAVDDVIGDVNRWSAGFGSLLSNVPESQALNLKSKLSTLKANVAFNELTAMREASKTGGALGSVAVRELELLESALGSLDQAQSPEQLIANLNKVKESAERWQQAAGAKASGMQPLPSHEGAVAPPAAGPKRLRFDKTGKPLP